MRIDSHVHFMVYQPEEHIWVTEELNSLKRSWLPKELAPLLQSIDFEGCVVVEARQMLKENSWLFELAALDESIKGIVGWVDLCSSNLVAELEKYAANPKFRGVRHLILDESDDDFMLRKDFQRGIRALQDLDLTYDLLILPKQIPLAIKLVENFPDQRFVLDNLGLPSIKDGSISPWDRDLAELAKSENVFCKLSGLDFMANWQAWQSTDFIPYLDIVFSAFGVDRLMIGSNWPVCTVSGNYQSVINIVAEYIQQFSPQVQAKILGENCAAFYQLID